MGFARSALLEDNQRMHKGKPDVTLDPCSRFSNEPVARYTDNQLEVGSVRPRRLLKLDEVASVGGQLHRPPNVPGFSCESPSEARDSSAANRSWAAVGLARRRLATNQYYRIPPPSMTRRIFV